MHPLIALQRTLEVQNGASHYAEVTDFLVSDTQRRTLPGCQPEAPEQLFVIEPESESEAPFLGVFIAEALINTLPQLQSHLDHPEALNGYCAALEGVSHFIYLMHRAEDERPVTLLELELQAEVDKFIYLSSALKLPKNSHAQWQLHSALFENFSLHSTLEEESRHRYQAANDYAARLCERLMTHTLNPITLFKASLSEKIRLCA